MVGEAVFLMKELEFGRIQTVAFLELTKGKKIENNYKNVGFIFQMIDFFLNENR